MTRRNSLGRKLCLIEVCPVVIADYHLMCVTHWHAVPQPLRLKIFAALRQWTNDPSNADKLLTLQRLQGEAKALVS